ncbi:MAG: phytanoyl-CoA dioxygenase family protein [Planctomycetota bacterium]|nr:phytanoyl-CoA dioxygenase family protein [Planctomycetota bacterium]
MSSDPKACYERDGYYVARGAFTKAEIAAMREHFMARRAEGPKPGDLGGNPRSGEKDPLNSYPRMINMHNWDETTAALWKDARLKDLAAKLIGDEAELCQTMLYFKPPGARGQGLHQDCQYIQKKPLIGVWVALDRCDEANGQMVVVPGSHKLGLLDVTQADEAKSFVGGQTILPEGSRETGVGMEEGDVLFFDGYTIHGSYNNTTADRFRRSFIVHYVGAHAKKLDVDEKKHMSYVRKLVVETAKSGA